MGRALAVVGGSVAVVATMGSAIRTVILPRGVPAILSRVVFLFTRRLFRLRVGIRGSYERRDHVMAMYAPVSLLVLLGTWLALVLLGYTAIFWGLDVRSLREAYVLSGSSLLTLGFARPGDLLATTVGFTEAAIGLMLLAMLITYLPSIYSAFSKREAMVQLLEVRAGSPPSPIQMLQRLSIIGFLEELPQIFRRWEMWFVEVEESHVSFPALPFFRSPQPQHHWVAAAGTILDTASLHASTLDLPRTGDTDLCIRAGYVALRRVASFFHIPYDPDPAPTDPISIAREEFDEACERLAAKGVPLKEDRDQAWRDFAGWRVNYDTVLVALAAFLEAPRATWSGDRIDVIGADAVARPRWRPRS